MSNDKTSKNKEGKEVHYTSAAIIKKDDKYLLIDRVKPPFGFACVAGHIEEGENEVDCLKREVEEESGLKIEDYKLLYEEEIDWNWCSRGVGIHHWYLYECEVSGEVKQNYIETKSIGWYSVDEIKKLKLEPAWEYWFKKLKII